MSLNPMDLARWAGLLSAGVLAIIVIFYGSSPPRQKRFGQPPSNIEVQTPAGLGSAAASAVDSLKGNPWLLPALLVIIFAILTIVRPWNLLPAKGDVQKGAAPHLALVLSVLSDRHLEEGDSFELRLDLTGTTSSRGTCLVTDPGSLSATAIAPGTDVAAVEPLTFNSRQCTGLASWIVGIRKSGEFVIATTISRKTKASETNIGSAKVTVSSAPPGVTSDALFSALITALVALFSFLRNGKP